MKAAYDRRIRHKGVYTTTGVAVPADELPGHTFFEIHSFEMVLWGAGGCSLLEWARRLIQLEILSGYMSE